jgi:RNA recognition motif-containing protein
MAKRLFVGNLPYSMSDTELEETFAEHGTVISAAVVRDRSSSRSRGFGFVEMATEEEAETAISSLDGKELGGRRLRVNEALPKGEDHRPWRRQVTS